MINQRDCSSWSRWLILASVPVLLCVVFAITTARGAPAQAAGAESSGAVDWKSKIAIRVKLADELYKGVIDLNKSYESLVAASSQRSDDQWDEYRFDLSTSLFKPMVDQASDIAFAWGFMLDRVEHGEIDDENVEQIFVTADKHLKEARNELERLRRVRDGLIVRARVLAGANAEDVNKSMDWGNDISSLLEKRTDKLLSNP